MCLVVGSAHPTLLRCFLKKYENGNLLSIWKRGEKNGLVQLEDESHHRFGVAPSSLGVMSISDFLGRDFETIKSRAGDGSLPAIETAERSTTDARIRRS